MSDKQSAEANEAVNGSGSGSPDEQTPEETGSGAGRTADTGREESAAGDSVADDAEATGTEAAEIERLRERAEEAEARAQEYWDRILRMEAEKDNIRKRAERDVASARRQALEKLATEMLGVRDSLELGRDAANQEDADLEKIREGTDLTLKMLTQAMDKFGIEEIDPLGEKFDPELHQAMSMQEAGEDQAPNTITAVVQKGYRLEDRLLRPALVIVAK